jgi:hypothetical protein
MAKKKETEEEVVEVEPAEKSACKNPSCGHLIDGGKCPYCGYEN